MYFVTSTSSHPASRSSCAQRRSNDRGDIAFTGIFQGADLAPGPPGVNGSGLGSGVFVVDKHGHIFNVVKPGDEAPGGATFDLAAIASINDLGDVAFGAHLAGEECLMIVPQEVRIACISGTYLKKAATGKIETIVRQGDPMPGGGTCRGTRGRVLNNRSQVAFLCDMTPEPDLDQIGGLFFRSKGTSHPIARPGDPMPGGGKIVTTGPADTFHLSNSGDVTFNARLDTGEHGLYVASRGSVRLVARTGTVIPGVGTIVELVPPDLVGTGSVPSPTGANERGQILFTAAVNDGSGALRGVILLATRADDQDRDDENE